MLNPVFPESSYSNQQLGKVKLYLPKLSTVHLAIKQLFSIEKLDYTEIYKLKDKNQQIIFGIK
jgi:hypothetical protein